MITQAYLRLIKLSHLVIHTLTQLDLKKLRALILCFMY